jgi:Domain of unknown function (DUF4258)
MPFEQLIFRMHAIQRMLERNISVEEVKELLKMGKAIENYPEDKPYPSYLVLGKVSDRPVHVVAADNTAEVQTIIITVYKPDPKQWDSKFERRKK